MLLNYVIGFKYGRGAEDLTMNNATETCSDANGFVKEINGGGYRARVFIDPINCRLKVQNYQGPDLPGLALELISTARDHQLSKVIFYALEDATPYLEAAGYRLEGRLPRFFKGREAFCHSYFVDSHRSRSPYIDRENEILIRIRKKKHKVNSRSRRVIRLNPWRPVMRKRWCSCIEQSFPLIPALFGIWPMSKES